MCYWLYPWTLILFLHLFSTQLIIRMSFFDHHWLWYCSYVKTEGEVYISYFFIFFFWKESRLFNLHSWVLRSSQWCGWGLWSSRIWYVAGLAHSQQFDNTVLFSNVTTDYPWNCVISQNDRVFKQYIVPPSTYFHCQKVVMKWDIMRIHMVLFHWLFALWFL